MYKSVCVGGEGAGVSCREEVLAGMRVGGCPGGR